jgi:hypothetical protein
MDHIDEQSAALGDRARPQVANHIRTIEVQTLDALLRIEELLRGKQAPGPTDFTVSIDAATLNAVIPEAPKEAPKVTKRKGWTK